MKILPDVCVKPRNNRVDFDNDLVCDPDPVWISQICNKLLSEVCL